jgi:hypothetical protein
LGPGFQEALLEGGIVGDDLDWAGAQSLDELGQDLLGGSSLPLAEPRGDAMHLESLGGGRGGIRDQSVEVGGAAQGHFDDLGGGWIQTGGLEVEEEPGEGQGWG